MRVPVTAVPIAVVALFALFALQGPAAADIAQWDLDGGLEPTAGPGRALVAGAAPPAFAPDVTFVEDVIGREPALVARFSRGTFLRMEHGLAPNGGGTRLNRYTVVMDVLFPDGTSGWQALLQTDESNSTDGEWYVQPDLQGGGIGISGNYGGQVPDGVWHRLALVVDLVAGTYTSFIDGRRVQQNTGLDLDGRFSMGPAALLFADENEENAAGFVNSVQVRDEALTEEEVAALGGPTADGVPLGAPAAPVPVGLWEFDDPDDLTRATIGIDLVRSGAHRAVAGSVPGDGATRVGPGSHYRCEHGIAPAAGQRFVNEYSLVFDIRLPSIGPWYALYQTNTGNANDGDCFIDPSGRIGVGSTGYSEPVAEADTWHRVVIVVDNARGRFEITLDGRRVLDGAPQDVDGRFSLDPEVLFLADDNGDDGWIDVSLLAIHDRALSPGETIALGGAGPFDPQNRPPVVLGATGPEEGEVGVEYTFTFQLDDPDGDRVRARIDWGDGTSSPWTPLADTPATLELRHRFEGTGFLDVRVEARDEHGAGSGARAAHRIRVTGDVPVRFLTMPYLQNVRTDGITIMWELDALTSCEVAHGVDAGLGRVETCAVQPSGFGTFIYKATLRGLEPGTVYHYRAVAGGVAGEDRLFRTAPAGEADFSFGVWSDSQGTNHGAYPPDPLEPTKSMMAHMAGQRVDFAVTAGDLAEDGGSYGDTRSFYLDRVAKFLGQEVPWFVAWGNHDVGRSAVIRKFADMPSGERPGFDPGWGSFSFDYGGCHFICIDFNTDRADIVNWLEGDLRSPAARQAKFTFLFVHVPPYCELWIDGDGWYRANLVPLMERYGVDVCFSGHTHEYERGLLNDTFYCITGGGSWLDFPENLVRDWPHMTVGGHHDLPTGIDKGLVNEYVLVEVKGDTLTCSMYAFNFDGSVRGVLDGFYKCEATTGEFVDESGDGIPDRPPDDRLCVSCATDLACAADPFAREVTLAWTPARDLDATGYEVVRDGEVIAGLPLDADSFVDTHAPWRGPERTFNYGLRVVGGTDADLCPVLECRGTLPGGDVRLAEDFDAYADDVELEFASWFPVDVNDPLEVAAWTVTNPGGRANPPTRDGTPSTGGFVISDSDAGGSPQRENVPGSGMSHDLWSPIFSCEGMSAVWLHMDVSAQLNNNGEAVFDVDVSGDAGETWRTVFRRVAPDRTEHAPRVSIDNAGGFFGRLDLDLSSVAAGRENVRFRLRHFEPNWDWWVAVDNVVVDDAPPPSPGRAVVLDEDFADGIPAAWTVRGLRSGDSTWTTNDPCRRGIAWNGGQFPYLGGRAVHRLRPPFAILDSDCDPDLEEDELLITPVLDCSRFTSVVLEWSSELIYHPSATHEVLVSVDGGETFAPEPLFSYGRGALIDPGEDPVFAERILEVPMAAGEPAVAFAFRLAGDGGNWWWAIDDVRVTGSGPSVGGGRVPGDCNGDGALDLSDAVCVFLHLFAGGAPLPCGDGTTGDPANVALLSANGDAVVDISDGIHMLQFLFNGGPAHALGTACREIDGCGEMCR